MDQKMQKADWEYVVALLTALEKLRGYPNLVTLHNTAEEELRNFNESPRQGMERPPLPRPPVPQAPGVTGSEPTRPSATQPRQPTETRVATEQPNPGAEAADETRPHTERRV